MKQIAKLAWRNLWRNRRRTLITVGSVLMAVVLAVAIRSFQKGVYENMISNAVRFSTGYLEVHLKGYWEDKSINNAFTPNSRFTKVITSRNISLAVPHLESYALASSGPHTKGVEVIGIDPQKENKMTGLAGKISVGKYLAYDDDGVLVGDGLARYLELKKGDTLILLGQGYHGTTAAGKYPIQGIFHYPLDQLNSGLVYLSLPKAGELFGANGMLTSVSLMLVHPRRLDETAKKIRSLLDPQMEVLEWQKMNKTLVQEIQGDNAGGIIMLAILYLVVAFGVFGTVLMMTLERKREFAVMVAVGMPRRKLMSIVFLETVFIGIIGVIVGIFLILPVVVYFHGHPINLSGSAAAVYQQFGIEPVMPASLLPSIFVYQGLTVLGIALVSVIYPLSYVGRLPLLENLKQ